MKKKGMLRACDSAGGGSGRWQHFASVLVYWSAPSSSPQSYHCPEPACQQQGRALDPRPRPARTAVAPGGGGGRGSWSGPRNVQSRDMRSACVPDLWDGPGVHFVRRTAGMLHLAGCRWPMDEVPLPTLRSCWGRAINDRGDSKNMLPSLSTATAPSSSAFEHVYHPQLIRVSLLVLPASVPSPSCLLSHLLYPSP